MTKKELVEGVEARLRSMDILPDYMSLHELCVLLGIGGSAESNRPSGLEDGEWWCPNCKKVIESHDITNDERHGIETCMCRVN